MAIRVAILTVSDRVSAGQADDHSGPLLREGIQSCHGATVVDHKTVPDSIMQIQLAIKAWTDGEDSSIDLILTTGGTGFGVRDVTPEAVKVLLDKDAPGLVHAMLSVSLRVTPLAMLARPVAGIRKHTIIVTLPGSPKGCLENLEAVRPALSHALELVRGGGGDSLHKTMLAGFTVKGAAERGGHSHSHSHDHARVGMISMDPKAPVALRPRESPYPMISLDQAVSIVKKHTTILGTASKKVDSDLVGYVLAEDVFAKEAVPGYTASIVDGYAVVASDCPGSYPVVASSTATSYAAAERQPLRPGQVARIATDKVSEDGRTEEMVTIACQATAGQEIRQVGSDIAVGDKVLSKGELVSAVGGEVGVAASVGIQHIQVYRKPIVAVLSSGNEVVEHSHTGDLPYGTIRDTNRPTLKAAIQSAGIQVLDLGIATDSVEELANHIRKGLDQADVLISTGGVSMGEVDFFKPVLERELGATIHFGRVNLKPGKPTTFATIAGETTQDPEKLIFALPGNPVSAIVTFYLFVLPSLRAMAGHPVPDLPTVRVVVTEKFNLDSRPEFVRVHLTASPSPSSYDAVVIKAVTTGLQQSSRIMSVKTANGLLKLPQRSSSKNVVLPGEVAEAIIIGEISY
ncbi:hypothetical protein SeMB42_g01658 [Synchytrium endobioticum]|uniref:MoaB/Mog domain-containing protein n=1 Tax=Synchytrium endobioticum TaxID=286115 RepID=A0A507DK41_9FUNG|nr:hypothetical protein SeMB42_g01658 [Synchytrium endobioticum]